MNDENRGKGKNNKKGRHLGALFFNMLFSF